MNKYSTISAAILFACLSTIPIFANASRFENFIENTVIRGHIELEAVFSNDYADDNSSDLALATADLHIDSTVNKNIFTHFLLLHEDDTPLEVDEASISIRMKKIITLTTGRLYLPFGNFETNMISDSLPHELSEARETAIQLEYEKDAIFASFYLFNGDVSESNANDTIDNMGFNIAYYTIPLTVGLSYINNLGDSDLITESITSTQAVVSYTPGLSVYTTAVFDNTSVFFEYVSALDEFNAADLAFKNTGAKPSTVNLEIGYRTDKSIIAAAFQSSTEAVSLGLPETRLLLSYTMKFRKDKSLTRGYSLAFELASDKDYSVADGGTGKKASALTAQLAVVF
jgi:hypothetical protein